jgi:hypothetical protein
MKTENLRGQYIKVVDKYLKYFCEKHQLKFQGWVGDRFGEIAYFGDNYYINFNDIRIDIDTCQPKDQILNWYDSVVYDELSVNYTTWISMHPPKD